MSALEKKPEVLASTPDEDLVPGSNCRGILRVPSRIAWRLDLPEAPGAGLCDPRHNSRGTSPELEKNQEILPSTRAEALFQCFVSREIPLSYLSPKRALETLQATQEFTQHTICPREEHRGSLLKSRRAPVLPPYPERRVHFPSSLGRKSQHSRRTSRGGGLHLILERNSRGHATISKDL